MKLVVYCRHVKASNLGKNPSVSFATYWSFLSQYDMSAWLLELVNMIISPLKWLEVRFYDFLIIRLFIFMDFAFSETKKAIIKIWNKVCINEKYTNFVLFKRMYMSPVRAARWLAVFLQGHALAYFRRIRYT